MNKLSHLLALLALLLITLPAQAFTERFSIIDDVEGNIHCRTRKVNLTNEREPLLGVYTLCDQIDGKPSATLTWEIYRTDNEASHDFVQHILEVTRDLSGLGSSRPCLSLYLSNGDRIYFDATTMVGFTKEDWHPLIHVSKEEDGSLVGFLMFPLEYCWSEQTVLSLKAKKRYEFIMKQLQTYDIVRVAFTDIYRNIRIEGEIKLARPTAETIKSMVEKGKKNKKSLKKADRQ